MRRYFTDINKKKVPIYEYRFQKCINPQTKRKIFVKGKKFRELVKQGIITADNYVELLDIFHFLPKNDYYISDSIAELLPYVGSDCLSIIRQYMDGFEHYRKFNKCLHYINRIEYRIETYIDDIRYQINDDHSRVCKVCHRIGRRCNCDQRAMRRSKVFITPTVYIDERGRNYYNYHRLPIEKMTKIITPREEKYYSPRCTYVELIHEGKEIFCAIEL